MDYWYSVSVPANTPEAAPIRVTGVVAPGIVRHVWLFFPKGHKGTTKIRILRFEHQVWPTNLDEWYLGDGTVIEFTENYPLIGYPYEFTIEGYNSSADHAHTAYVRFTIHPHEAVLIPGPPASVEVYR